MKTSVANRARPCDHSNRRGSTLIIVIALLGIMAFLGLTFYTFAKQERQASITFSQSAQTLKAPSIEPDSLFDFALQQVILGPVDANTQSILWGGRHSLLANMFGRDGVPFNGEGVNVISYPSIPGQPAVDMNYDGVVAASPSVDNQSLLNFVDSPVAQNGNFKFIAGSSYYIGLNKRFRGTGGTLNNNQDIPEPDVNYNSPDINSIFLSYDAMAYNPVTSTMTRAVIPSFFRPQNLRYNATPLNALQWTANSWQGWYCADGTSPNKVSTANQVMRPHPQHYCVDGSGNLLNFANTTNPIPRYTTSTDYQTLGLRRPFSYSKYGDQNYFAPDTVYGNLYFNQGTASTAGNLGIWTNSATGTTDYLGNNSTDLFQNSGAGVAAYNIQQYQQHLDVDTDGDGVLDAILMDLGYPPVRRGDGKLVVPLFAISIRDLNGLVNVNASGNLAGNVNLSSLNAINTISPPANYYGTPTTQLGYQSGRGYDGAQNTYLPDNLSKSNMGLSTAEINPIRVLTADPTWNTNTLGYTDQNLVKSEAATQLGYFLKLFDTTMLPNSSFPTYRPVPGRSITELSNLEWLFLNVGRPNFNVAYLQTWFQTQFGGASPPTPAQQTVAILGALTDMTPGRNGEANQSTYASPANLNPITSSSNSPTTLPLPIYNSAPAVAAFTSQVVSYVSQVYPGGSAVGTPNIVDNITNHLNTYNYHSTDVPAASLAKFFTTRQLANAYDQPLNLNDLPKPGLSITWYPAASGVSGPINLPTQFANLQPDDNMNFSEGEPYVPPSPPPTTTISTIQWMTPMDFRGSGQHFQRYSWGADGQPGFANVDDDGDGIVDNFTEEGWPLTDDTYTGGGASNFVTYGKFPNLTRTQTTNPMGAPTQAASGTPPSTPLYYPAYSGYHSFYSNSNSSNNPNPFWPSNSGGVRWGDYGTTPLYFNTAITPAPTVLPSLLMRGSVWNSLIDDPAEMIVDRTIASPAYLNFLRIMASGGSAPLSPWAVTALQNSIANDSVFGPEEMLFLQGTSSDARVTDDRSRLAEVMPANLVASQSAANIRKRLTTVSSDRREFGAGSAAVGGNRAWECWPLFSQGNTTMQSQYYLFPPARYTYNSAVSPPTLTPSTDPYRPELFYYLQQLGSGSTTSPSVKLNVNRFLFLDALAQQYYAQTQYGFAPLPVQTSVQDTVATQVRQNMARDIYTLLYTLCFVHTDGAGNYDLDYRTVTSAEVPTLAQAKEMAQFAVNLVDALDPDSIITAFYYDPDLSNNVTLNGGTTVNAAGWDPAACIGADQIPQTSDDYVVYGVERQQLVISEATLFQLSQGNGGNTNYDTTTQARTLAYIELENVSPASVTLAPYQVYPPLPAQTPAPDPNHITTQTPAPQTPPAPVTVTWGSTGSGNVVANGYWRVRLSDPSNTTPYNVLTLADKTGAIPAAGQYNAVYLMANLDDRNFFFSSPTGAQYKHTPTTDLTLPAGGTFTISSGDGATPTVSVSDLRGSGGGALFVPSTTVNGATDSASYPQCNLDLVYHYWTNATPVETSAKRYWLQVGSDSTSGLPTDGAFLAKLLSSANGLTNPVRLTLETNVAAGPNPAPADGRLNNWSTNTWAAVDSTANYSQALATGSPTVTNLDINDMKVKQYSNKVMSPFNCSYPRTVPILSGTAPLAPTVSNFNSASQVSTANATPTTLDYVQRQIPWQLQYDRDFSSLSELLQLPLYGPDMLTSALAQVINPGTISPMKWPTIANSEYYSLTTYYNGATPGPITNYYPTVAAGRFLRTDNPDVYANIKMNGAAAPVQTNNGNRWYRLMNFLEVPSRFNQQVAVVGTPPSSMANPPILNAPLGAGATATPAVTFGVNAASGAGTYTWFAYPGTPGGTSMAYNNSPAYLANSGNFSAPYNLPQYFGWPRVHGQLNLNTIRHPQVLLSLLDDDQTMYDPRFYAYQLPGSSNTNFAPSSVTPFLDSADPNEYISKTSTHRQWWYEFMVARDARYSPYASTTPTTYGSFSADPVTGYFVPGTPTARPFKALDSVGTTAINFNYAGPNVGANPVTVATVTQDSPLEDTVLRGLPMDSVAGHYDTSPAGSRRLFEVGNYLEHFELIGSSSTSDSTETNPSLSNNQIGGTAAEFPLHPSARHRLLSKVMNNTTTRSNSFAVYVTVQYYEAAQVTSDSGVTATRIGGLLDDAPVHRGFFIVDRTGAIEQMKTLASNAAAVNQAFYNFNNATPPYTPYPQSFPVSTSSYSFQANTDSTGVRYANTSSINVPTFSTTTTNPGFQNGIRWKDLILYRRTLN